MQLYTNKYYDEIDKKARLESGPKSILLRRLSLDPSRHEKSYFA